MAATRLFHCFNSIKNAPKIGYFRFSHGLSATYAQTVLNLPETKITKLGNGVRVVSEQTDSTTSAVGLWVDAGSRNETPENNGVGHFFEHLAFTGTVKRTQQALEREIQSIGAQFGSKTSRERSAFYAQCLSSDVPQVVDILVDITRNTTLDQPKIDKQRQDTLNEMEEVQSDLKQVTMDYLHLTAYQGTPLSKSKYGPTENIKKFTKEDVTAYVRDMLVAPRIVLASSGNFSHDELVKLAEKNLNDLPLTYEREIPMLKPCRFTGSEVRDRDDWIPFAHIAVAVDTCGFDNPDVYGLMLAKTMIGRWDRTFITGNETVNELIHNIYKGEGCQSFDSFFITYRDTGLWGCHFVMESLSIDDFMFNLQNEWMKLCINATETDLIIGKNMLRRDLLHHYGNQVNSCSRMSKQALFTGKLTQFSEVEKHIESITLKNLKDICQKYIYNRCPAVAAVGPTEGLNEYNRTRSGMTWLRY